MAHGTRTRRHVVSSGVAAVLLGCSVATYAALAKPYTPADDGQVVERLPAPVIAGESRQAERRQRAALRATPSDPALALQAAYQALERMRLSGDARELGQARQVLAPWWRAAQLPPAVRLARAIVLQAGHDFEASLADLDALSTPQSAVPLALSAQATLTRASVLQVQGRWADARRVCDTLNGPAFAPLASRIAPQVAICLTELDSLQGQAPAAQRRLEQMAREAGPSATWLSLVRAELAHRQRDPRAGALYRQALDGRSDVYTLAAYADWLLEQKRPEQVVQLLADTRQADALRLRRCMALQRMKDPRAAAEIAALADTMDTNLARGDLSHAREMALFTLHLRPDPAAALSWAQRNWAVQREPIDAWLLLQAAEAAGQTAAAQPVVDFAQAQGWQDPRIEAARQARPSSKLAASAQPVRGGAQP